MTTKNLLLDHASIQQCEQLANGTDLHGKRAKALLLLNNGEINSAAAKKSGLTAGQLSYLLSRFKKVGMALFITASGQKIVAKKAVPVKSVAKNSKKKAVVKKPAPVIDVGESVKSNDDQELTGGDSKAKDKAKKKKEKKSSKKDKAKKASKKKKNSKGKKDKKSSKDKKSKKNKKGKKKNKK